MKYKKVRKIYEKGLENEDLDPTLVSDVLNTVETDSKNTLGHIRISS